ncbi:MAG: hypothetical protein JKY89_02545, partial [Immundisolibacteraceae bacterium]|nr:hypothetical protein [Immundisolibacteraceae bacterium]
KNLALITLIIFIITSILIYFACNKLPSFNKEIIINSTSQFIEMKGKDEYIIAKLTSAETFSKKEYDKLGSLYIGDSSAQVSAIAHYKYYIKLSELGFEVKDNNHVKFTIKKLHLSSPVAFDSGSLTSRRSWKLLGTSSKEIETYLKKNLSTFLYNKGQRAIPTVSDIAAKGLAKNMAAFYKKNGINIKKISVGYENSNINNVFNFEDNETAKTKQSFLDNLIEEYNFN